MHHRTRLAALLVVALLATFSPVAWATPLTVLNHSFESPALADGGFASAADSWTGPLVHNPSAGPFYSTTSPIGMDGSNFAYLWTTGGGASNNEMSQVLSAALAASTDYDLTVAIGNRNGSFADSFGGYRIRLIADFGGANETTIADSGNVNSLTGPAGQFSDVTLFGSTGPAPAALGENLSIVINKLSSSPFSYVDVDNVRLNAIPEPATAVQLGFGLVALAMHRRRRR